MMVDLLALPIDRGARPKLAVQSKRPSFRKRLARHREPCGPSAHLGLTAARSKCNWADLSATDQLLTMTLYLSTLSSLCGHDNSERISDCRHVSTSVNELRIARIKPFWPRFVCRNRSIKRVMRLLFLMLAPSALVEPNCRTATCAYRIATSPRHASLPGKTLDHFDFTAGSMLSKGACKRLLPPVKQLGRKGRQHPAVRSAVGGKQSSAPPFGLATPAEAAYRVLFTRTTSGPKASTGPAEISRWKRCLPNSHKGPADPSGMTSPTVTKGIRRDRVLLRG